MKSTVVHNRTITCNVIMLFLTAPWFLKVALLKGADTSVYFYSLPSDVPLADGKSQNALIYVKLNPFLGGEKAEKANGEKR